MTKYFFQLLKYFYTTISNPTYTFSPINYLLFWKHYNSTNTIILNCLAIIRRKSSRDVVALPFWSKILKINYCRVHFQLRCRSSALKLLRKGDNSLLFLKTFDCKWRIQSSFLKNTYFLQNTYFGSHGGVLKQDVFCKCCSVM